MTMIDQAPPAQTPPSPYDLFLQRYWAAQQAKAARATHSGAQPSQGAEPLAAAPAAPQALPATFPTPSRPEADYLIEDADRRALAEGLPFTARAVLQMAPDLNLRMIDAILTATWAPVVAAAMDYRQSGIGFLSRERLSEETGLSGLRAMEPGGAVERAAATIGLVRMVERGVPGAVSADGGEGWRGMASSWTITTPLADWSHTPARIGEPRKALPVGRALHPAEMDPKAMAIWLDPRHPYWALGAAGKNGLRLVACLMHRYGMTDVIIGAADAGRMLGVSRNTAWHLLASMTELKLATRGPRGKFAVRINSHLGVLTADDLRHNPRRRPKPSIEKAKTHDWTWFDPQGRALRASARRVLQMLTDGTVPVGEPQWEAWRGNPRPRGALIGMVQVLLDFRKRGEKAAREQLAAFQDPSRVSRPTAAPQASGGAPVPSATPSAAEAAPARPLYGVPASEITPLPEHRGLTNKQKIALMRGLPLTPNG